MGWSMVVKNYCLMAVERIHTQVVPASPPLPSLPLPVVLLSTRIRRFFENELAGRQAGIDVLCGR